MSLFLRKKRAQAAVELLTTYGWAIMGVILVIGVLSYFDVFDTKRFISEKCDTGTQIQCLEAYASDDGNFQIALRNNYLVRNGIVIEQIIVKNDGSAYDLWYDDAAPGESPTYIPIDNLELNAGNISRFGSDNIGPMNRGDKRNLDVLIIFRRNISGVDQCDDGTHGSGMTLCYNISGLAVVKVQNSAEGIGPRTLD